MITWNNLDTVKAYGELEKVAKVNLAEVMSGENGADRVRKYSVPMAEGMAFNYAAKQVDDKVLEALAKLAEETQLVEKFEALYNGEVVNTGEKRLVLHHMTRGQLGEAVVADGVDKRTFYVGEQKKIAEFANKVHNGEITNAAGEKFTTVVQIGIGGSDLGPRAMYLALENWAKVNNTFKMEAKFISNVDPDDAAGVLNTIDVAHSIFVLVSKSGTTLETLTNESFVKDALKNAGLDPAKHMIAVTSETSPLAKSADYLAAFFMDDYIGGRYSSTSAVGGAVLSLAFGPEVFAQFLEGAAEADKTAVNADIQKNPAMLDALIGVYERNILGYQNTAVLPYSQALSRFPAHLQQLDMESNGKSVNRFGEPVNYVTGPVIFGEPGTNGQ
ncbi:MAG: glucose-6-phosphate isomerase, partial [Agathobacter sp.]|nr:glucose-6-phosphate isomerase [Agathobacter sp.]